MKSGTRKAVLAGLILAGAAVVAGGVIWSGAYNVAADSPHTRPVHALLEIARDRSIRTRAGELRVPAGLGSEDQIREGAGNYDAMCVACHLAPGVSPTELSLGLYPAPPNLTTNMVDQAEAFWVIKHGIKASGMPAWGLSMEDEYIWNMAAFLQKLPDLDATGYRALVDSSGGHSHGGGETVDHHDAGNPGEEHTVDEGTAHDHAAATEAASDHHDMADNHHDVVQPTPRPAEVPVSKPVDPTTPDDHSNHDHQH